MSRPGWPSQDAQQFASGPTWRSRLRRFVRWYTVPLIVAGVFGATLVLLAAGSMLSAQGPGLVQSASDDEHRTLPASLPCPACGLGERCDGVTGRCVLRQATPVPCVEGTRFDEQEGYCVPEATPIPTEPPTQTLAPRPSPGATPDPRGTPTPEPSETPAPSTPSPPPGPPTPAPGTPDPGSEE